MRLYGERYAGYVKEKAHKGTFEEFCADSLKHFVEKYGCLPNKILLNKNYDQSIEKLMGLTIIRQREISVDHCGFPFPDRTPMIYNEEREAR